MKRGKEIPVVVNGRDDRSSGIEILMTDAFAKINPTEPLRLGREVRGVKKTESTRLSHTGLVVELEDH
jgi:hypothetical protein